METIKFLDKSITIAIIVALLWFLILRSQKEWSSLSVSILYLIGASFDMAFGRHSFFWISLIFSLIYLIIHREKRRERLARDRQQKDSTDLL